MPEPDERTSPAPAEAAVSTDSPDAPVSADTGLRAQLRAQHTPLLVLAAIGLLVLGFAAGALVWASADGDPTPTPGPVDIGFNQDMSAHHAQAVEMAGVALVRSTDPDVRRLAYDILTTQQSQLGRMQGWLQLWGAPARGADGYMDWMAGHAHGDHTGHGAVSAMPGMAGDEELAALRRAEGRALDVLFLQLMLRHHQGGLPMLEYAAEHAETAVVRGLAEKMTATQQGESRLITDMLTARGGSPLPPN
ncbi:DUF305 domain-containing protein [Nocardia brevicatena]|uniref:DUF305 domain-containing protein n=1 Tax=Nocardia brevicatena TaxID=37327 RepID=UPI0002DA6778